MEIKTRSWWNDDRSGKEVLVKRIIGEPSDEVMVQYDVLSSSGERLSSEKCGYKDFLYCNSPKIPSTEDAYEKGYVEGYNQHEYEVHQVMPESSCKSLRELSEQEFESIIDEAFEEGYAQAYSELQTKTERERALQEQAFDEGYDQAIDDLIEAGVIGEEEYLDEDCSEECYSEYEFGDVEDDEEDGEEEYCFSKELDKILNGAFVVDTKYDRNKKEDLVNSPSHYNSDPSGVKCIEITRHRNNNIGNVIKYVWRNGLKDGNSDVQDLEKAAWYLNDEIQRLKGIER